MKAKFTLFLLVVSLTIGCKKDEMTTLETPVGLNAIAPNGFNFSTTQKIGINVRLLANTGEPIANVPVTFHHPKDSAQLLKAITDNQGYIKTNLSVSSYIKELIVEPHYVGLINEVKASIISNNLDLTIGGTKGISGNVVLSESNVSQTNMKVNQFSTFNTIYNYLGTYDANGRPQYLQAQSGNVSARLLTYLNDAIPEFEDIKINHPEYLAQSAQQNINVVENGEVFITFVSEGASKLNAIAYYTYPTNNPPATENDIPNIKYIFPNTSAYGSGGGLLTGDKVSLGTFTAGTSIGLILFSNAWNKSTKVVNNGSAKFYSEPKFNLESSSNLKDHMLLMYYKPDDLFVIGFEDVRRDDKECDHDFNDLVLYATSYPKSAISKTNVVVIDAPEDTDGDGIADHLDEYPTDGKKAYNNHYPSKDSWGTLAFEDNWPLKGDYDMNDLVVNYRYSFITNASNNVVEIKASYEVVGALADYKNGFGVEFPFSPSIINDVTGYIHSLDDIKFNPNGTESGQAKAVIIPFDNQELIFKSSVNYSEVVNMRIQFLTPQPMSNIGSAPFNPFLISNGRRVFEIHLPGHTPTTKGATSLFGQNQDQSNPAIGRFYIGENNWPWAIHFAEPFAFPKEGKSVDKAFLHFSQWASSGGTSYEDWYTNSNTGYRNTSNIY